LATFITYVLTGGVLDAGKAFTAMSLLNIIRFPMNMLPMLVTYMITVRNVIHLFIATNIKITKCIYNL